MSESIVIALIGVAGAVVGSIATVAVTLVDHLLERRARTRRERPRKELLLQMLSTPEHQWRQLTTLMHVIGADKETTKNLLLQLNARASEDGNDLWGLRSRNPLP